MWQLEKFVESRMDDEGTLDMVCRGVSFMKFQNFSQVKHFL